MFKTTISDSDLGLRLDLTSADYHGLRGSYSSSQMKDLLDDPEYFYKKYILKEIEKESIPAFDIGTYFHTSILEPEKLQAETAVYTGTRRGKAWEEFQAQNEGKAIITESELKQALALVTAVQNSPVAMGFLKQGQPEISALVKILVTNSGDIYCPGKKTKLGRYGWEKTSEKVSVKECVPLVIKARADLLGDDFILDLKSTTGNAKSPSLMRKKISDYQYDLSAALYLDIFTTVTDQNYQEFLWVFASKDYGNSKTYRASQDSILVGRAKWRKAVITLANCIRNNWIFEDSMGVLEPMVWELEHIQIKAENIL